LEARIWDTTALQLSVLKPAILRLAGYFCAAQSYSKHDRVVGKSWINYFLLGMRDRPVWGAGETYSSLCACACVL